MAIVAMKRLRLVGLKSQQKALLRKLRQLGCVEISPQPVPEEGLLAKPDAKGLEGALREAQCLEAALAILKGEAPHKTGLLTPRREVAEAALFDDGAYAAALKTAEEISEAQARRAAAQAQRGRIEAQRLALAPWVDLPVALECSGTRSTTLVLGGVPRRMEREAVTALLDGASELYTLTWAGEDRENRYFMLCFHTAAQEPVTAALNQMGFNRMSFPGITGTAAENDRGLQAALEEQEAIIRAAHETILGKAREREGLELALDRASQEISLERAAQDLLSTPNAFCMEGWFPAGQEEALTGLLGEYTVAWETAEPEVEEYPQVPVQLKNGPLTSPMNMVTEMYSLPAYGGVDPNPLMAPFFILFYGIMMADMAYGIVMMLASVLYLKKARPPQGTMRNMMSLMGLCGVTTFLMGAVTGGFLGDFIPQIIEIIRPGTNFVMPALFTPLNDTLAILIGSMVLGFIQEITGMVISFVKKTRRGGFWDALLDEGAWWVIFLGAALLILGVGNPGGVPVVLILGGVMLVAGCIRKNPSIGAVGTLIGAVYNGVTGVFQDVLSYSRLMALMLSGSIIASVFNTLGSITGNVVAFVIISLIGNALNFTLNILGCFVHDLRLQCLEYFGKFYEDGGKPFRPLAIRTKYVNVIKEEQ